MGLFDEQSAASLWKPAVLAAGAVGALAALWSSRRSKQAESEQPRGTNGSERMAVRDFNQRRRTRTQRAMKLAVGWSAANTAVGAVGAVLEDGPACHFWEMHAGWNAFNTAVCVGAHRAAGREDPSEGGRLVALKKARRTEKLLLIDAALATGSVAAGAAMWRRGQKTGSERLRGWGPATLLEGAVAVVFDAGLWWLHRRRRRHFEVKIAGEIGCEDIAETAPM